jgi:trimeric autotransporter adhesin
MRRFVTFAVLIFFAIPFGASLAGCSKAVAPTYCNGENSGVQVGQLTTLDLEPRLTGISLNEGEIGRMSSPSGKDCRGNSATASSVTYASTNIYLADVAPSTGALCAGSWNRNSGAAIADYTVCTPSPTSGVAYLTASSQGVVSNAIPIFVHPVVTNIVLGPASTNCTTDPASDCVDLNQLSGFDPGAPVNSAAGYTGTACLSQGQTVQLVARSYQGTGTSAANNISNLVGPLQFTAQNASVVTVDANGVATAAQPGSSTISAAISQASSTAGFFSTCPPQTIVLSVPPALTAPTAPVSVNQNTTQPLVATVTDTQGNAITNVQLEYVSTNPTTIPAGSNSIVPTYPSTAAITAICQPPTCNSAPFNEIGLFGNGSPVTSNPVQIAATGTDFSTVLYIGSTNSQYLLPVDFTTTTQLSPVRLPYAPNSMALSEDLSTIYMGTSVEIMVYSTASNSVTKQDNSISGTVLAVSPDNSTVIVTDPVRALTYLYLAAGGVSTEYGGVATSASWTPDSATVYITTADGRLLVHSNFTGWSSITLTNLATNVAITVPNAGVYLGGNPVDVRTNCPATTISGTGLSQTTSNVFYPDLGPVASVNATQLAATTNGLHILGASTTAFTDIATTQTSGGCPVVFTHAPGTPLSLAAAGATTVNSVLATSDSAFSFVTYQGTGGVVPQYAVGTGTLSNIALQKTANGTPLDAISGAVSADNNTLYIGSEGDNVVHILTRGATGFTDTTKPIVPALPVFNGTGNATPNLIVQRPRKATS